MRTSSSTEHHHLGARRRQVAGLPHLASLHYPVVIITFTRRCRSCTHEHIRETDAFNYANKSRHLSLLVSLFAGLHFVTSQERWALIFVSPLRGHRDTLLHTISRVCVVASSVVLLQQSPNSPRLPVYRLSVLVKTNVQHLSCVKASPSIALAIFDSSTSLLLYRAKAMPSEQSIHTPRSPNQGTSFRVKLFYNLYQDEEDQHGSKRDAKLFRGHSSQ